MADKFASLIPSGPGRVIAKIFTNLMPLLAMPVLILAAFVKQGLYESSAAWWNTWVAPQWFEKAKMRAPIFLSTKVKALSHFLTEHSDNIFRAILAVGIIILTILGYYSWAVLAAVTIIYHMFDSQGLIPRKLSLFMERYLPIMASLGFIFTGAIIAQVAAVIHIAATIFSRFSHFFQVKADHLVRKYAKTPGYSIAELEAPLVPRELSYEEIQALLKSTGSDLAVSPAHYTKGLINFKDKLEEDFAFAFLETACASISWETPLLIKGLLEDERLMAFMAKKLSGISSHELKESFHTHFSTIASLENMSFDQYAREWIKQQMHILVQILEGKVTLKDQQVDVDDALHMCAQTVSLLKARIEQKQSLQMLQESLISLAIEGGDYCARGIKRACSELLSILIAAQNEPDPLKNYENKIYASLIRKRDQMVEETYEIHIKPHLPARIADKERTFAMYRLILSFGFSPLTPFERQEIGLSNLILWWSMASLRRAMFESYEQELLFPQTESQKKRVFENIGSPPLYLEVVIKNNSQLTSLQKAELIERIHTLQNTSSQQNLHYFALASLHILQLKNL